MPSNTFEWRGFLFNSRVQIFSNLILTKIMGILTWIIVGLIAGAIAKAIHPGKDPGGFFVTIAIGIVGAIVGGFISSLLGFGTVDGFGLGSLLIAVLGAVLVLYLYRRFSTK